MERKRILRILGGLCIVATLLLVACGGGDTSTAPESVIPDDSGNVVEETQAEQVVDNDGEGTVAEEEDGDGFPSSLVLHPEATNVQLNPAAGTFIYTVPGMVAEILEYLEVEMKAKGWEELGQPTIMGHLATLNMTMDKSRVTISMQHNEISKTTRVQMLLLQQQ